MILRTWLQEQGREVYVGVVTDNGGDQTYGPFASAENAMSVLRSAVENDFELEFEPEKHVIVPPNEED